MKRLKLLAFFLTLLSQSVHCNENAWVNRLQSIYLLRDDELAIQLADEAVNACQNHLPVYLASMRIYARAGNEAKMLQLLKNYEFYFPNTPYPRELLEEIAWGVVQKAGNSSTPMTRAIAIIAAAIGNDAKGVTILANHLDDPHRAVRLLAVNFASKFRDGKLQENILRRLYEEKDFEVKVALLEAAGAMHIEEAKPLLMQILENERSSGQAKASAIASLVHLYDSVDRTEIERFVKHPRAPLRAMACALIRHNDKPEDCDLLLALLNDENVEVQTKAVEVLGEMRPKMLGNYPTQDWLRPLTQKLNAELAISSAWALMLYEPEEGQKALAPWLNSSVNDERIYASAALVGAGKYGFPLTFEAFQTTQDACVKMNLGLALIQQDIHKERGAEAILSSISVKNKKWMVKSFGRFEAIAPCDVDHRADIANYPEVINQTTRLELLNQLALMQHPAAEQAIRGFLLERPWGVSGAASAMLLTEGDHEALSLIRNLLKESQEKIRLQSALILGLWGADPEALLTLQTLYPTVTRSQKEQILEALGRIGEQSAIPFLVQCLNETYPTLRIIAATAILQTLYH